MIKKNKTAEDKPVSNFYTKALFLDKEQKEKIFRARVNYSSIYFQVFDWALLAFLFYGLINYFSGNWSFNINIWHFFIGLLAAVQTFFYHGFLYEKILDKKAGLAFNIDIIFVLSILFSIGQLLGGIASLFIIIYFLSLSVIIFFFPLLFVIGTFLAQIILLYILARIDPVQIEFANKNPEITLWLVVLLFLLSVFFSVFSFIYSKIKKTKNNFEDQITQLVADKGKSEAVLQSMGDGVFVVNREMKLNFINDAAQKMLGISNDQVNRTFGHFYGTIFKLKLNEKNIDYSKDCPLKQAIMEGKSNFKKDLSLSLGSKKQIYITLSSAPIVDAAGDAQGAVAVIRDVTKEKEIERMQMEFVSIASHELLTPITQVQGHLSMIIDENIGKLDDMARNLVSNAFKGIKRISRLVKDLMNISRIQRDTIKVNPVNIVVEDMIKNAIKDFQDEADSNEIKLIFEESSKKLPDILTDPDRLGEVLINLIGNAIKFTKKGSITIFAEQKKKGFLTIGVKDTGIGIGKEHFDKIFEKFYQVDSSHTREAEGTGLGLYITKTIINLLGGEIWIESQLGKGSTFYFTLPLVKEPIKIKEQSKK